MKITNVKNLKEYCGIVKFDNQMNICRNGGRAAFVNTIFDYSVRKFQYDYPINDIGFNNVLFVNCTFVNVQFEFCNYPNTQFINCVFDNVSFTKAQFVNTKFTNCNLIDTKISHAVLTDVVMTHSATKNFAIMDATLNNIIAKNNSHTNLELIEPFHTNGINNCDWFKKITFYHKRRGTIFGEHTRNNTEFEIKLIINDVYKHILAHNYPLASFGVDTLENILDSIDSTYSENIRDEIKNVITGFHNSKNLYNKVQELKNISTQS